MMMMRDEKGRSTAGGHLPPAASRHSPVTSHTHRPFQHPARLTQSQRGRLGGEHAVSSEERQAGQQQR